MRTLCLIVLLLSAAAVRAACNDVELVVLGSGGPELDDGRRSAGYTVLIDGEARVLVDLGAGALATFDEAGLTLDDLEAVALTHLHVDHAADVPALVKGSWFSRRTATIELLGPTGNEFMPGTSEYLARLFDPESGPFRYLGDQLPGGDGAPTFSARDIDAGSSAPITVLERDGVKFEAIGARHGPIPAVAWAVEVDTCRLVFSGDMAGTSGHLEQLARGADLLIANAAIPESAGRTARRLHMPPSTIGRIAAEAGVKRLLLSHLMNRSQGDLESLVGTVRERYAGEVLVASDGLRLTP